MLMTRVSQKQQVTQLLCEWRGGDSHALEKLIPLVQPELQRLAQHYMSRERPGHTLQTTALLDDAYLQLAEKSGMQWQNRAHFFAVAAQIMRRIMVDHARQRHALKRGGGAIRVTLDECAAVTETRAAELLALDEALEKLAAAEVDAYATPCPDAEAASDSGASPDAVKDHHGIDLNFRCAAIWSLVDAPDDAVGYALHRSRYLDAVIRVYDDADNVIATHEHAGDFVEP